MKRELPAAVLLLAALLVPASGFGDAKPAAYVDEVANYTGASDHDVDELLREALREAGYVPLANVGNAAPCSAGETFCLAERARARGAEVAVRAIWVEVATDISLALEVVSARNGQVASYIVRRADPTAAATVVGSLLAADRDHGSSGGSTAIAWTLAGTSAALLLGGGASSWRAWQQRRTFFAAHVDEGGDVVGISPADARAAERQAHAWSVAGAALLAGAAASGITATVMFTRSSSESAVAVGGRF
jgi:hypothetical protein